MLSLPDVTLVCVYTVAHELHEMAVDECLKHADFGDEQVIWLHSADAREYERFFFYEMPKRIHTSHILAIQWDSWIINPSAWTEEFLACDYVGAPWWYSDYNVGNSGFCLRSKRLMEFIADHEDEFPIGKPEDHVLCREYQQRLPQFTWAPDELAFRFSFERVAMGGHGFSSNPLNDVFGFHGLFNFPLVLKEKPLLDRLMLAGREPWITNKLEWRELRQVMSCIPRLMS